MANTSIRKKAGLKALRTDSKRAIRNQAQKAEIEIHLRLINRAIKNKDEKTVKELLTKLQKLYDKAAKNNVIRKKTADRAKSRLAKRIKV